MNFLRPSVFLLPFLLLLAACGDDDAPPPVDGGGGTDMPVAVDGNLPDATSLPDTGTADDLGVTADAGDTDGAVADDAGGARDGGGSTAVVCGGRAGDTCGPTQFCDFAAAFDCGFADGMGTCRPRPAICTDEFLPVCGCDGNTYSNACGAQAGGTDIRAPGECPVPPPTP